MKRNEAVERWVAEMAALTGPDRVVWCDGSEEERRRLTQEALGTGQLLELNQEKLPGCYLHRSNPNDVARTEQLTFLCTRRKEDAGSTNNWMAPADAYARLSGIYKGALRGRTLYVVPFLMGPRGSKFSKVGVQVTDSIYVVLSMRIMTRMGDAALAELGTGDRFVKCLHSLADLNPERRFICHFPEDYTIWSVGSGYGGNALLGKKCFALRMAGWMGRQEGWLAEHMLIVGLERPDGRLSYVAGAFPSACGKTNLAMLVPPASYKGWKIHTVGDDIAWIRVGPDGRLWAINPEAGFFGVAPGTNPKTNTNAMGTFSSNSLFTNVALTPDRTVWWEGMEEPKAGAVGYFDWQGRPWSPGSGTRGAHPNARFTAPARQCPSISSQWEGPDGVPLSAILFGCRRSRLAPLVVESLNWRHGVYLGATIASETTAAAAGAVGVVRRDPMANLPFLGYNVGDYFRHWLSMETRCPKLPRIYRVNWFRVDGKGKFIWPGFGDNLRVLRWILDRCEGDAKATETPLGNLPTPEALDLAGLDLGPESMKTLLEVDRPGWTEAARQQEEFFQSIGPAMPRELVEEKDALVKRLGSA
ncbi:MAG: phosphoenolpyruvate carboxykinase (GTP) [Planctomycetes bacterium]|nr:phosphoenolpyruvate carboxykinase (GTP) [Planctomycetota bacterium]